MKQVTLFINNDNLDQFKSALAIKGQYKAEYCKSKTYTTTVFLSLANGQDFSGSDLFNLGFVFGTMTAQQEA